MSIIERVAQLLDPIEKPNTAASQQEEKVDPIMRVVSEKAERFGNREDKQLGSQFEVIERAIDGNAGRQKSDPTQAVAQPDTGGLPESTAKPSRPITVIDRGHLRRQSIMTPDDARTENAECFRRIKRQILAQIPAKANKSRTGAESGPPSNLVQVTSALPVEGKSFCAINLAISIALEMDRTVLLVDADVGKPSIPKMLGVKMQRGLLDVLLDRKIELAEVLCKTDIGKLTLLSAGTLHQHATELLASDAMRDLLQEMAERYHDRIIIFDSPPLLAASEASVLASRVGQVVIVVEAGKTSEASLKAALARIESSNITGLLLNKGEALGGDEYGEYA